jgi:CarD family transcriptional regulator
LQIPEIAKISSLWSCRENCDLSACDSVRQGEPSGANMFKVGEIVVYSNHGLARILDIRPESIGGSKKLCYILETGFGGATPKTSIKLPVERAESLKLRKVIEEEEVPKIIDILRRMRPSSDARTWNRRLREYQEKMHSGCLFRTAEVFRDLSMLKRNKDLSFSERKLFVQAKSLIIKELAIARKTSEEEIEQEIESIFNALTEDDPLQ